MTVSFMPLPAYAATDSQSPSGNGIETQSTPGSDPDNWTVVYATPYDGEYGTFTFTGDEATYQGASYYYNHSDLQWSAQASSRFEYTGVKFTITSQYQSSCYAHYPASGQSSASLDEVFAKAGIDSSFVDEVYIEPEFQQVAYNIDAEVITGGGSVTRSLQNPVHAEQVVTFTAVPDPGYEFVEWRYDSGSAYSPQTTINIFAQKDMTLEALFQKIETQVSVATELPSGMSKDDAVVTPTPGQYTYSYGDEITLQAYSNNPAYEVQGWYDSNNKLVASGNDCTYTVGSNPVCLTARYSAVPMTDITFASDPAGAVDSHVSVPEGSTVTMPTPPPISGYEFDSWYGEGSDWSESDAEETFDWVASGASVTWTAFYTELMKSVYVDPGPSRQGRVYVDGQENPMEGPATLSLSMAKSHTLVAKALPGYAFDCWLNDGEAVSDDATYTFDTGDLGPAGTPQLQATYKQLSYNITCTPNNDELGTVVSSNADGGELTAGSKVTFTAYAAQGCVFDGFYTENGVRLPDMDGSFTFTVEGADRSFEARFHETNPQVSVQSDIPLETEVTGAGIYAYGASVTLSAKARNPQAYVIAGWYDQDGNPVASTLVDGVSTVTFTATESTEYTVHVEKTSNPVSITAKPNANYGSASANPSGDVAWGGTAALSATPSANKSFLCWMQNGRVLSRDASYAYTVSSFDTVYAWFIDTDATNQAIVQTQVNNPLGGSASGGSVYAKGTTATLKATAHDGYDFVGWTDQDGTQVGGADSATLSYAVTGDATLTANFKLKTARITASVEPGGAGTVWGDGIKRQGAAYALVARASEGYVFDHWEDAQGANVGTDAVLTGTIGQTDEAFTAYFTLQTFELPSITYRADDQGATHEAWGSVAYQVYRDGSEDPLEQPLELLYGDKVVVSATPASDAYAFAGYEDASGAAVGNGAIYTIDAVNAPVVLSVDFAQKASASVQMTTQVEKPESALEGVDWTTKADSQLTGYVGDIVTADCSDVTNENLDFAGWYETVAADPTNPADPADPAAASAAAADPADPTDPTQPRLVSTDRAFQYTLSGNTTLTAKFTAKTYGISMQQGRCNDDSTASGVTVTSANCYRNEGDSVQLACTPNDNTDFSAWHISASPMSKESGVLGYIIPGSAAECTFTLNPDVVNIPSNNIIYAQPVYSGMLRYITLLSNDSEMGIPFSEGEYYKGDVVTFYGAPAPDENEGHLYLADSWTDEDGNEVPANDDGSCTITIDASNTLTVHFKEEKTDQEKMFETMQVAMIASVTALIVLAGIYLPEEVPKLTELLGDIKKATSLDELINDTGIIEGIVEDLNEARGDKRHKDKERTIIVGNDGGGTATGGGVKTIGETAHLRANPSEHYTFSYWKHGAEKLPGTGTDNELRVEVTKATPQETTYTAIFDKMIHIQANAANENLEAATDGGTVSVKDAWVKSGDNYTISATAAEGYEFDGWYEAGETTVASKEAVYTFKAEKDRNLVAKFKAKAYTITTTSDPVGAGDFTINEVPLEGTTKSVDPGSTVTLRESANNVPETTPERPYRFTGWIVDGVDKGAAETITFVANSDTTVIAHYDTKDTVSVTTTADPVGAGTATGGGAEVKIGTTTTLTATPGELEGKKYYFESWQERSADGVTTPLTCTDPTSKVVEYVAKHDTNAVAVFKSGAVDLKAVVVPSDLTTSVTIEGTGQFKPGESHTLIAKLDETKKDDYTFEGWFTSAEGETAVCKETTYTIANLDTDTTLYARYHKTKVTIKALSDNAEQGSVEPLEKTYDNGAEATVVATAKTGYAFKKWTSTDGKESAKATYTFKATEDKTLTAIFEKAKAQKIYVIADAADGGTVTENGTKPPVAGTDYQVDDKIELTAKAKSGYYFMGWYCDGSLVSMNADTQVTVKKNSGNMSIYVAAFNPVDKCVFAYADPTDGGSVSTSFVVVDKNSQATLAAIAKPGYEFEGWYDILGKQVSTDAIYTFTVRFPKVLKAEFSLVGFATSAQTYLQTDSDMEANSNVGSVSGAGTTAPGVETCLQATANEGYVFDHWEDANGNTVSTDSSYYVTPTYDVSFKAVFKQASYTLTLAPQVIATGVVGGAGTYAAGSTATATAIPNSGCTFIGWYEDNACVSSDPAYQLVMDGNHSLTALFDEASDYTVKATVAQAGGGLALGAGSYAKGDSAILNAVANAGYEFASWQDAATGEVVSTDANWTFAVSDDVDVVATFDKIEYSLSTDVQGKGSVPDGALYSIGDRIRLLAVPDDGYKFAGWYLSIDDGAQTQDAVNIGTAAQLDFTFDSALAQYLGDARTGTLTARFVSADSCSVQVSTTPALGAGSVSGDGSYTAGAQVTLSPAPAANYGFDHWEDANGNTITEGVSADGAGTYTFTVNADVNLTCVFKVVKQINVTAKASSSVKGFVSILNPLTNDTTVSVDPGTVFIAYAHGIFGKHFLHWVDESGNVVAYDKLLVRPVQGDKGDKVYTAVFAAAGAEVKALAQPTEGGHAVAIGGSKTSDSKTTLIALPKKGWKFTYWTDEAGAISSIGSVFAITWLPGGTARTYTAHFVREQYDISAAVADASGTASSTLGSVSAANTDGTSLADAASSVDFSLTSDESAILTAVPAVGSTFLGWYDAAAAATDDPLSQDTSYTLAPTDDTSLQARFAPVETYTITSSVVGSGTIDPAGATTVNAGDDKTFTITPGAGSYLSSVAVDGCAIDLSAYASGAYTYTFSDVQKDSTIAAVFTDVAQANIVEQPVSQAVLAGTTATFNCLAQTSDADATLTYQWVRKGAGGVDVPIDGAVSSTLSLANVSNADVGDYACVVTTALKGAKATQQSAAATLSIASGGDIVFNATSLAPATYDTAYDAALAPAFGGTGTGGFDYEVVSAAGGASTSVLPTGLSLSVDVQGAPHISGTYTGTVKGNAAFTIRAFDKTNHAKFADASFSINLQAKHVSLAFDTTAFTFNGLSQTPRATNVPDGVAVGYTYSSAAGSPLIASGQVPTHAGSYAVSASGTSGDGMIQASGSAAFTIAPAQVSFTLGNLNPTYDGTAHAVAVSPSSALITAKSYRVTYTGEPATAYPTTTIAPVNAGTYHTSLTLDDPDFTLVSGGQPTTAITADLVIAKATQTIEGTTSYKLNYDSDATMLDAKLTSPANSDNEIAYTLDSGGDYVALDGFYITPKAQGTGQISAQAPETCNYSASNKLTIAVTVGPSDAARIDLADQSVTYDKTAHPAQFTCSGAATWKTTYTGTGTTDYATTETAPVHAGTYRVDVVTTDPNYTQTSATATLTIMPVSLRVKADDKTRTYGQSNPEFTYQVEGSPAGNDVLGVDCTCAATNVSDAGTYPISVAASVSSPAGSAVVSAASDYAIYAGASTLTVEKSNVDMVLSGTGFTYNTLAQTPALSGVSSELLPFVTYEYTGTPSSGGYYSSSAAPVHAGTYHVSATLNATNYEGSVQTDFTIERAPLTITVADATKVWGDDNPVFGSTSITGLQGMQTAADAGVSFACTAEKFSNVGTYAIDAVVDSFDYTLGSQLPGALSITKREAISNFDPATTKLTYNAAPQSPKLQGAVAGMEDYVTFEYSGTGSTVYATSPTAPTHAGTYHVSAKLSGQNVEVDAATDFTIGKAAVSCAVNAATRAYGDENPQFTSTITGLQGSDTATVDYQCAKGPAADAGTYLDAITATMDMGTAAADYEASTPVPATLTVTPAPLAISVDNAQREHGQANPAFSSQVTGLKNGDAAIIAYTCVATAESDVGTYAIRADVTALASGVAAGKSAASNYTTTITDGVLTVGKHQNAITFTGDSFTYNAAAQSPTIQGVPQALTGSVVYLYSGTVNDGSDYLSETAPTHAGVYTAHAYIVDKNEAGQAQADFVIEQAPVKIAVDDAQKVWGSKNPQFTSTVSGVLPGDTLAVDYACQATRFSPVGSYTIRAAEAAGESSSDYTVTVDTGVLSVSKLKREFAFDSFTGTYNGSAQTPQLKDEPAVVRSMFTYVYSGTGSTVYPETTIVPTHAGTYHVTASASTANIQGSAQADFTIAKAPKVTCTVDAATRAYGDDNPQFASTITGLQGSDTATVDYQCKADKASDVGTYDIAATVNLGAAASDYEAAQPATGTLTIKPAPLAVSVNNAQREYGQVNPAFTSSVTGLKNGDKAIIGYACAAMVASDAGTYAIDVDASSTTIESGITAGKSVKDDYVLTAAEGVLTVDKAHVNMTLSGSTFTYNAQAQTPALGGVSDALISSVIYEYTGTLASGEHYSSSAAPTHVGTYHVSTALNTTNYEGAAQADFTIGKAPLDIAVASATKVWGDDNPVFGSTSITGLQGGQTAADAGVSFACEAQKFSDVGSYPISAVVDSADYSLASQIPGTLTITKRERISKFDSATTDLTYNGQAQSPQLQGAVAGMEKFVTFEYTGTGSTVYAATSTAPTHAGTYHVSAKLSGKNAEVDAATDFTIERAVLDVAADDATRVVGTSNPAFASTITGLVNSDRAVLSYACSATIDSAVGTYQITPTVDDILMGQTSTESVMSDYKITLHNATLTVVEADAASAGSSNASGSSAGASSSVATADVIPTQAIWLLLVGAACVCVSAVAFRRKRSERRGGRSKR